ncbi:MAG TPA: aminotransferase class I/II-fold pyridoxal phosphate-dependent enzyme [Myxococcaceae bacterium]|nr:aminotransferase class I/II-fold pyridoxal phosphate-dependent enzyme [Myxococcaceae bacterium]
MSPVAARVRDLPPTVFSEFSALAVRSGAVNLGQGFPDFDGPEEVREAAVHALRTGVNQYALGAGSANLRRAIAEHAARFHGQEVDPERDVTVTSGATEALFDALLGLLDPGDEAVLFEPFYDSYAAAVTMAGATVRPVALRPPDAAHASWWFDSAELEGAFGPRTRVVVVNTPHNPTGKVFSRAELEQVAALCERHDTVALTDEVYEHLVYAPARHIRVANLPGMAGRTLTVSSGGKSFSYTGWKVGWTIGPAPLRRAVAQAHQYVTFAVAAPLQEGIAHALRLPDGYFDGLLAAYTARRDRLLSALREAGFSPWVPEGAYFVCADVAGFGHPTDDAFCRWLTTDVGVAAIPLSAFYLRPERAPRVARFAFCKTDAVLDQAAQRLRRLPTLR